MLDNKLIMKQNISIVISSRIMINSCALIVDIRRINVGELQKVLKHCVSYRVIQNNASQSSVAEYTKNQSKQLQDQLNGLNVSFLSPLDTIYTMDLPNNRNNIFMTTM